MKVHTLQNQAVYMQAYDPILLENDRQLDLLLRQINPLENPSFHDYGRNVPFYVLDVGCGAGHWLLEAATHWNHSSITGFDMVDILIPEAREHDKIHFSRGNLYVVRWPMPDKTFDLVRMANLSLCIPYDRWEHVLAEVHRVLTIDGRLELIDDQIFFPYAEEATARPTSLSLSIPPLEPPPLNKGVSFFEMDEEEEETDADSIGSQSTLISEGDTISSSTKHRDSLFISNPDAPSPAKPKPASAALDDDDAPTSATTIKPADTAHPSEWSDHARASKDMETVFEKMLNKRFGIHSRPSEFIVNVMAHVFGNGEKLQSYHLKLAPKDAHIEYARSGGNASGTGSSEGSDKDEKAVAESKKRINGMTRPWFNGDGDKEEKKRLKKLAKSPTPTTDISFFPPDTRIPETLSAKAAGRLGLSGESPIPKAVSRIPENVSAKAAHRLGIPMTGELKSEESAQLRSPAPEPKVVKATTTSPASLPASPTIATAPPLAETRSRDSQVGSPSESRLSAKAAHRLGISYSALTEAAASAKASSESSRRPQSSSSTLVNLVAPLQSPGLIVGSSTFIPMSPAELEMHTCKYIHTLIGCKPALAEYISSFVDEEGNRIESDEDFDQAIWDYECFRRRRFNWPSEIPDCWDADPDTDAPESVPTSKSVDTPKSATFRNSMTLEAPSTLPSDASDPSSAYPYKHDDLTHVRTLRVYEAIKTGEYSLSTLQFPRTAPRSPPR
ncbi:hypothetical protein FPV67DRAFT_1691112 [Lyophyllum atratum]|nr:hypothetical protein FPV67DRAFT_1691112 [Lyophyllum atratum]